MFNNHWLNVVCAILYVGIAIGVMTYYYMKKAMSHRDIFDAAWTFVVAFFIGYAWPFSLVAYLSYHLLKWLKL